jgi:hypothetical protein
LGLALIAVLVSNAIGAEPQAAPVDPWQARVEAGRHSWAFSAPREPAIPVIEDASWCKSPVDRFILAKLEERGLRPAPPADKRTLIRRAYFDLIGLPPRPEEVEAFVRDDTPDAFAKVIDRLLASPHYGERWARHWLDVVRYTDSFDARGVGSAGDVRFAWRYRDWVVNAFNRDLPYDRFVKQQIAGDLLAAQRPDEFGTDGIVATTMYVLGNWPGGDADREKMMTDIVDDQVDVTSRAFLGVTLACARCHDHKFDPFSQKDYYSLAGIFFSTHFLPSPGSPASGAPLVTTPIASPEQIRFREEYDRRVASLQNQVDEATDDAYRKLARSTLPKAAEYLVAIGDYEAGSPRDAARLTTLADEHHLDPVVLARWADYLGPSLHAKPVRKLLTKPSRNIAGMTGVDEWSGADGRADPCVIANDTDHPVTFATLTIPARSLSVHPGPRTGVGIGWTSPITGAVRIRGRVADGDPNGGDGINWRIERSRGDRIETLADGGFPNGGTQDFAAGTGNERLDAIDVQPGDVLQLTIFPKANYVCDTTIVDLEIAAIGVAGAGRAWNLSRDVVSGLLAGNPHADAMGTSDIWQFFEAGEENQASVIPPGARLAQFFASDAPRSSIANDLTSALIELDRRAAEGDHRTNAPAAPANLPSRGRAAQANAAGREDTDRRVAPGSGRADSTRLDDSDVKLYRDLTDPRGPFWAPARNEKLGLSSEEKTKLAQLSTELTNLKKSPPPPIEQADALIEGGVPQSRYAGIHDCPVMARGRYDHPGAIVPRGFPRLLAGDGPPPEMHDSGRLELAQWIASPENPMTAKVMVNRIWQHHFGQAIVRTPNNFGKLGVPPTHPELLDYLARRFVESGWSIKAMHRLIMLSSAYQQSCEPGPRTFSADPDNELLGRMNRQRLEAEPFRDAMLAVGAALHETMGGPAFRDMAMPRRTLYLMTIRSDRSNYRMLFDAADPTGIVDQRIDSTVAPQALFLMNDPFVADRAKTLAERVAKQGLADDKSKIDWLYHLLYARPATDRETLIGLAMLRGSADAWPRYCQMLLCANEFVYVD